jgi:KAP family P-loop domain
MAGVRTRSWAGLTGSSQAAFQFAFGARARLFLRAETDPKNEGRAPFVSTSTLLLGIARTHVGPNEENPLRDLLARYGRSVTDLEQMLRSRMQGHTPFDLDAEAAPLHDFPELTPNVASALDAAGELAVEVPSPPKRLPLRFLFGGLLKTSRSRAFETLAMTLGSEVDLPKIADEYRDFLEQGPTARYADFLGSRNLRDGFQLLPRVIDDAPTRHDELGFQPLVDSLDGLLNSNRSPLPLAIAITARWGRGKTSVMRQLRARLRRRPAHGVKKRKARMRQLLARLRRRAANRVEKHKAGEKGPGSEPPGVDGVGPTGKRVASTERRWHTVWFEAWKYEGSERLWAALAQAIYRQPLRTMSVRSRLAFKLRLELRRRGGFRGMASRLALSLAAALALGLTVAGVASLFVPADQSTGAVGWTSAIIALIATIVVQWLNSPTFGKSIRASVNQATYAQHLGFTEDANHDIATLIKLLTRKNDTLAVFIDDLDRCTNRHVVDVLNAVNQIFNATEEDLAGLDRKNDEKEAPPRRCVFIFGMDREAVAASIDVTYKDTVTQLRERSSPLADDYGFSFLSKIVQLTVAVPQPLPEYVERLLRAIAEGAASTGSAGDQRGVDEGLVEELAGRTLEEVRSKRKEVAESGSDKHALDLAEQVAARRIVFGDADSKDVRSAEEAVLHLMEGNPRQIKRFDNAFRLQLMMALAATDQGLSFTLDQLVALGRWVAIRLRWPALATALDEEPALLSNLEAQANGVSLPDDEATKRIIAKWARWFDKEPDVTEALQETDSRRRMSEIPFEAFLPVA